MKLSSLSLTVRLAGLFAAVAIVTFTLTGAYLYQALDAQLERRDASELIGKVDLVRHLLAEVPDVKALAQSSNAFYDAMVGHKGLALELRSDQGQLLLRSGDLPETLPQTAIVPSQRKVAEHDIGRWHRVQGRGLAVAAWGNIGRDPRTRIKILVALQEVERSALLRQYGQSIALAVVLGAVLAAILGYAIVRLGLQPLRSVIAKTNSITARRIDARLVLEDAPRELHELIRSFNNMLDRLQEGIERLSRFSSDLAHDLRTPLANLMLETQVALSRERNVTEYRHLLESNVEELERLSSMIENTLFLARAENAQLALKPQPLDLLTEMARIEAYFEAWAQEAAVLLVVESVQVSLCADPVLFQRALSNLVSNAVAHTPAGGAIRISGAKANQSVVVEVANSGTGITPDHIPYIFDRYYRGDPSRTTAKHTSHSSGLGLAIVKAIMKLHGGSVEVSSKPLQGTVFKLIFPDVPSGFANISKL